MNVSDDELAQAVEQVLAYYYEQEREHRQTSGEGSPHILDSLETLKRWLEGRDGSGEGDGDGQPGDFGGGGGMGLRHNILAYSESKTMKARQLIEADPLKPIPFRGPAPSDPAGPPSAAATGVKQEIKKATGGTAFLKKLRDPSQPKSKYNLPRSEHETEHLLGETVVQRLIHDDYAPSDFNRAGSPDDPMRSASVNVPYGDFDYSGPERSAPHEQEQADLAEPVNHVSRAMKLLATLQDQMSPDELDAIIDRSQSMSGEEFHAMVRELVQQRKAAAEPTSRFDLNFGEEATLMVSTLLEDDIPGGKAPDDHSWGNLDKKQLAIGTKVEMEHTNDHGKAEEIAADHLTEDPDYYKKLEKAGLADELES